MPYTKQLKIVSRHLEEYLAAEDRLIEELKNAAARDGDYCFTENYAEGQRDRAIIAQLMLDEHFSANRRQALLENMKRYGGK
jgi:hypothetical protein